MSEKKVKRRERWQNWRDKYGARLAIALLVVAFFVAFFWNDMVFSLMPGEAGVFWDRFTGTDLTHTFDEGLHVIMPWNKLYIYDTRVQEYRDTLVLLSKDGLPITVRYSARYRPDTTYDHHHLPTLHQKVGPDYCKKVVEPEVVEALRKVLGNYRADSIYAADESGLIEEVRNVYIGEVNERHPEIMIDKILIQELSLPATIDNAIQEKLEFEQRLMAYEFKLDRERQEKERKVIEAQGIAQFDSISGISIIKWRALEVTQKYAESPNTKIVVVGTDDESLPIILNAGQD